MSKLYIIGNGLDLHFHLPTSTKDFKEIISKKHLSNHISVLNTLESYGIDWSDYEKGLSEFDLDEFLDDNIEYPDYLSDHEYDRDSNITDMDSYVNEMRKAIDESFTEMVKKANEQLLNKKIELADMELIEKDCFILSFNYTSTIEKLYSLNCCHVHGYLDNGDQLIYGYAKANASQTENELCNKELNHDYYIDYQKELALNFYYSLKKIYQWDRINDYLLSAKNIDTVVVLGHSLGDVDKEYFEYIEQKIKPLKWIIYYHNDIPPFKNYSFSSKVMLKKW